MYNNVFLVRFGHNRFNPQIELDAFISMPVLSGVLEKEAFEVARRLDPNLFEKEVGIISGMKMRVQFDGNCEGPYIVRTESELDREKMEAVLCGWVEDDVIEEKLEEALMYDKR